jgi:hypothetical protein
MEVSRQKQTAGKSNAGIREKAMADSHFVQEGYWGDGLDIHISIE